METDWESLHPWHTHQVPLYCELAIAKDTQEKVKQGFQHIPPFFYLHQCFLMRTHIRWAYFTPNKPLKYARPWQVLMQFTLPSYENRASEGTGLTGSERHRLNSVIPSSLACSLLPVALHRGQPASLKKPWQPSTGWADPGTRPDPYHKGLSPEAQPWTAWRLIIFLYSPTCLALNKYLLTTHSSLASKFLLSRQPGPHPGLLDFPHSPQLPKSEVGNRRNVLIGTWASTKRASTEVRASWARRGVLISKT